MIRSAGLLMAAQFVVLLVLLILVNPSSLAVARGISDFMTKFTGSSCPSNASCNVTAAEDKRGIPTGANPLHNRHKKDRVHHLEIQLDKAYSKSPPPISAEVPYTHDLKWSIHSRLKNVVQQFPEPLNKLQEFWSTLEDIDETLCVDSKVSSLSSRCIKMGDSFVSNQVQVNWDMMRKNWQRSSKQWKQDSSFIENLECLLETQPPRRPNVQKNDQQVECGICYAQILPLDEELGDKSGSGTDYAREKTNCNRAFNSVCLGDCLHSITTTRQSFNVLFRNCPYCSEPIAVKINIQRNKFEQCL